MGNSPDSLCVCLSNIICLLPTISLCNKPTVYSPYNLVLVTLIMDQIKKKMAALKEEKEEAMERAEEVEREKKQVEEKYDEVHTSTITNLCSNCCV